MVKRVTAGIIMLLLIGLIGFNWPSAKAQVATPSSAVITVSGIPSGTKGLAVEVTVDTAVVTLGAVTNSVGGLSFADMNSVGVGVISETDLPSSVMLTVSLNGVAVGTSMFTVGAVKNKLGSDGTALSGASATVDQSTITVAAGAPSPSPSPSAPPVVGAGMLSSDTFTVTIDGAAVGQTNALNVTISFSDSAVAVLDESSKPTLMGTGATLLLSDAMSNVLTVAWDGTISDNSASITAMLKPGTKGGTTMISVTKVEQAGGTDVTSSVAPTVTPDTITNGGGGTAGGASFGLIGPSSVVGPGKAAVALSVSGTKPSSATLNGSKIDFVSDDVGIAIITVPASGSVSLSVSAGGSSSDVGSITVSAGSGGKPPVVNSARVQNRSSSSTLRVIGNRFAKDKTTLEIVPTDHVSDSVKVAGKVVKATYSSDECIPSGSYINVTTAAGTGAKKIKVKGSCDNPLVE